MDDGGYLILNEGQPYSIEIASPTKVETFVLWFPQSWAGQVEYTLNLSTERLLEFSPNDCTRGVKFFDEYVRHDEGVTPALETLRTALKSRELMDDGWVEEKLRELPEIQGDEDLVERVWESVDALGAAYIWQLLLSF